jgi:hypothetical protein
MNPKITITEGGPGEIRIPAWHVLPRAEGQAA